MPPARQLQHDIDSTQTRPQNSDGTLTINLRNHTAQRIRIGQKPRMSTKAIHIDRLGTSRTDEKLIKGTLLRTTIRTNSQTRRRPPNTHRPMTISMRTDPLSHTITSSLMETILQILPEEGTRNEKIRIIRPDTRPTIKPPQKMVTLSIPERHMPRRLVNKRR